MKHLTIILLLFCSTLFGQEKTCVMFERFYDAQREIFLPLDVEICSYKDNKTFTIRGEFFKSIELVMMDDSPVHTIKDKKGYLYFLGFHSNPNSISFYSVDSKDLLMFFED